MESLCLQRTHKARVHGIDALLWRQLLVPETEILFVGLALAHDGARPCPALSVNGLATLLHATHPPHSIFMGCHAPSIYYIIGADKSQARKELLSFRVGGGMPRHTYNGQRRQDRNTGSYLLLIEMRRPTTIRIGRLGVISFARGHYVYVGSAMRNLSARIARHLRKDKTLRWHVDYLRRHADDIRAVPIPSSIRQECEIAHALSSLLTNGPARFGSSDCKCPTHLFYSPTDPLRSRAIRDLVQQFRAAPST